MKGSAKTKTLFPGHQNSVRKWEAPSETASKRKFGRKSGLKSWEPGGKGCERRVRSQGARRGPAVPGRGGHWRARQLFSGAGPALHCLSLWGCQVGTPNSRYSLTAERERGFFSLAWTPIVFIHPKMAFTFSAAHLQGEFTDTPGVFIMNCGHIRVSPSCNYATDFSLLKSRWSSTKY